MALAQKLSVVTLAANNLQQLAAFYKEQFGWIPLREDKEIVFFQLNGTLLGLYGNHDLAEDAGVSPDGQGFKKFTLAVCLSSEKEVDEQFEKFRKNKLSIPKPPEKKFWGGYSGYVADIENNLWEIAYNPFFEMDSKGDIVVMK